MEGEAKEKIMARRYDGMEMGEAALKGALASVVGGMVLKLVWEAEQRTLVAESEQVRSPTTEAVETVAQRQGIELSAAQTKTAAAAFYNGNMALWGAIFGLVQSRLHPPGLLHGLALGGLVYAANFPSFGVLPKLGLLPPPSEQSVTEAAAPVVAHVLYGLTTAAVFEALS